MKRIRSLVGTAYVIVDLILLLVSFYLPHYLYYGGLLPQELIKTHSLVYAFWMVSTILLFLSSQLYETPRELTILREATRTMRAFALSASLSILILFFLKVHTFSRLVIISNFFLAIFFLVLWRIVKRYLVSYLIERGFNNYNVLIVGAGKAGRKLYEAMHRKPQLGFRVVGFLDDRIPEDTLIKDRPVLGAVDDFEDVARRNFIDQVFITIPSERDVVSRVGFYAKLLGIAIQILPDNYGFGNGELHLQRIDDLSLLEYYRVHLNYKMIIIKRLMDLIISTMALILLLPVFFLIGCAIKLNNPGPVFYSSKRWGRKGRLFNCYKFRSMVANADLLKSGLRTNNEMDGPVFKIKNDPRITRVGAWLRKYSLDELPQIWNVFKGDMSLVGPRPLPEEEKVGEYKLEYLRRLSIKPGLTCLWQVRGRNDIPFTRWMKLDDYYIRNWSPKLDIEILLRTIPAVVKGKGAY